MLEWFKTLKLRISHILSYKRGDSADSKAIAKSSQGTAVATTGSQSPACVAEGNITIAYGSAGNTAIEDEDTWRKLLECFTDADRIATNVLDPRFVKKQQDGSHLIKSIAQKFSAISLSSSDPRASNFIQLRDLSASAIQQLVVSRDREQFQQRWLDIGTNLKKIKGS